MISPGVPMGAQMHCGASCTWPGTPASSMVGTSGRIAIRFALVTASARKRPALIGPDAAGSVENATGVWPATTDCTIGPPPLNGTITMSSLSDSLNSSVELWGRADTCYGEIIIPSGAHKRDQLLHILSPHRWMHHKHLRRSRSDDDRLEISHGIVGKLRIETGVDPHC